MRPVRPLDLKGIARGSEMRLFLDGVEAWRGLTFLGTISADWLAAKVQEQLDHIEMAEWLRAELAAAPTRRLGSPAMVPSRMLSLPSYMPVTREVKAKRRAARHARKRRPHRP